MEEDVKDAGPHCVGTVGGNTNAHRRSSSVSLVGANCPGRYELPTFQLSNDGRERPC
jgi:hypothetical protein